MTIERDLLRRKALIAAGSVVLALGLSACPGTSAGESAKGTGDTSDTGATDTGDTGAADTTDSGSDTSDSGAKDTTDSGATDSSDSGADTSDSASDDRPVCTGLPDTGVAECCTALSDWCSAEYGTDTMAVDTCIYGPGYDGSTGCIPWGPPAPPEFRTA